VRDIPTEIPLGAREGLPVTCAANFDDIQPIQRAFLTQRVGRVEDRRSICIALSALADC